MIDLPLLDTRSTVQSDKSAVRQQLYWNHFAYPVEVGEVPHVFLTDRSTFVRVSKQLAGLLSKRPSNGEAPEFSPDLERSLFDVGLLSADTPQAQFNSVMVRAPRDTELRLLHIITSYTCNLTCKYCFMLSDLGKSNSRKFLPFTEAKQGIDLYFSRPHRPNSLVNFYGGEPLLHPQLVEDCLDYITSNYSTEIIPKIVTNGTLIGERVGRLMSKYRFDLAVSMDGDEKAHNVYRVDHQGRGSYEKVVAGIRYFQQEVGNNPKVIITVGEHNIRRLPEVVQSVLDLEPKAIYLSFPRELHNVSSGLDDDITDFHFWVDQYARSLDACFKRGVPELNFAEMLSAFLSGKPVMSPCAACGNQMSVGPGAKVGPCQAFVAAGKFTEPLPLLQIEPRPRAFADWENVSKASSRKCTSCPISAICGGDCSFDRFNRTGSLHEPLQFHCDLRLKMASILAERAITGKPVDFASDHGQPNRVCIQQAGEV
ncbi:MAG: radical SAM protein [Mycobacterium sp.]|nr:radical SAM protein [Mycobacterium sp.]